MVKNNKKKDLEFEKHLQKIEDSNYQGEENYDLPENPTPLQIAKFNLCQNILRYKRENNFTREQIANQLQLSKAETEDILFGHIDNFTLDRLTEYASKLFHYLEIKVTKAEGKRVNI